MALAYIILIVVLGVIALLGAGGLFLLRPSARRRLPQRETRAVPGQEADTRGGAAGTETLERAREATLPPTVPPQEAPPAAPPAPPVEKLVVEKPPPSAGRMVRLRARLARSQSGFGSTLLNLLSRDRLDDET
ncbi:MAG TPA: signal recognition particle-docking protein FtsY, partial [Trebonia sp.]